VISGYGGFPQQRRSKLRALRPPPPPPLGHTSGAHPLQLSSDCGTGPEQGTVQPITFHRPTLARKSPCALRYGCSAKALSQTGNYHTLAHLNDCFYKPIARKMICIIYRPSSECWLLLSKKWTKPTLNNHFSGTLTLSEAEFLRCTETFDVDVLV